MSFRSTVWMSAWIVTGALLLGVLLLGPPAAAQAPEAPRNLGFEAGMGIDPYRPDGWFAGGEGYEARLDEEVFAEGRRSLRLRRMAEKGGFGVASQMSEPGAAVGRWLKLTGQVRTEDVEGGYAGLWVRLDSEHGPLFLDNMRDRGVRGTTPWKTYEVTFLVDPETTGIFFGGLLSGSGTAWFDDLSLEEISRPKPAAP